MGARRLLLALLTASLLTVTRAECSTARVRKAWDDLKASEQKLYLEAVGLGMTRGYHVLFTELHSETQSATEAYQTCGFLYWNRRFLLAYENMLRSLGSKYECVTIPYWDFFADYARFLVGTCAGNGTSIESCAPILRGFGGSAGTARDVAINGKTVNGNCVSTAPYNAFCQSSSVTDANRCAKCIPRSNWLSKPFPSGFGYAGLAVLLSQANGFRQFSNAIQYGIHNSIHDALSSTMATYMAPADPIFFSHHATVDMLHQVYIECQLGEDVVPTSTRISRFAFQQCSYQGEPCPMPTSNVTQRWMRAPGVPGSSPSVPVESHPQLGAFFAPTPAQYWQLVSTKALGESQSYTYQLDNLLLKLQGNGFVCPRGRARPRRAAAVEDEAPAASSRAPARELWGWNWFDWFRYFRTNVGTVSTPDAAPTDPPTPAPAPSVEPTASSDMASTNPPSGSSSSGASPAIPLDGSDGSSVPSAPASGFDEDFQAAQVERDYVENQSVAFVESAVDAAAQVDGLMDTAYAQTELIECQAHDEIVGVVDYSGYFRDNFAVDAEAFPRCFSLLDKQGEQVRVHDWQALVNRYYRKRRWGSWHP